MNASGLIDTVRTRFPGAVIGSHHFRGDATVLVSRESLIDVARALKNDAVFQMNFLIDLTAVDFAAFGTSPSPAFFFSSGVAVKPSADIPATDTWPGPPEHARFGVIYHFFSQSLKHRLRLVVPLKEEDPEIDSLTPLCGRSGTCSGSASEDTPI
jgi:NADH-quinone oxidoreductase subunit C